MIPVLFDKAESNFAHNGYGFLTDTISCVVTEERNGEFELTFQYPITGKLFSEISDGSVIKAKANETSDPQLFRIYQSSKPLNGIVTFQAEHISYELCNIPLDVFSSKNTTVLATMSSALSTGYKNIGVSVPKFEAWSDIATLNSAKITEPCSIRSFLGGQQGSVLDVWGGEYEFDNFTVKLHSHRGTDKGVCIEYGKNLTDLKQDSDISDCYTHIFPYAVYSQEDGGEEVYVYLKEKILPIPDSANLGHIKVYNVNLTDKFSDNEKVTETKLRTKATAYAESCSFGTPRINLSVSFIQLWQTEEYKNIAPLERVSLCDTVTVRFQKLGVNAKTKVIKTVYDTLKEKYTSITLGNAKSTFADTLKSQNEAIKKIDETIKENNSSVVLEINKAVDEATKAITGQNGGYIVLNPSQNPQEFLILDKPNISDAINVWRWNLNGLGHSSAGYDGTYSVAITADGHINGNFIFANSITGDKIQAATITAEKLNVTDLSALNATIGGFKIDETDIWSEHTTTSGITIKSGISAYQGSGNDLFMYCIERGVDESGNGYTGIPFFLTHDGVLLATHAIIGGTIYASDGTIGGFCIAGDNEAANGFWNHSISSIVKTDQTKVDSQNPEYAVFLRGQSIDDSGFHGAYKPSNVVIGIKKRTDPNQSWSDAQYTFSVSARGKLIATDAEVTGKITATSGSFECSDGTAKTLISNGEAKFYTTVSNVVKRYGLIRAGIDGNISMTNPALCIQSDSTNATGICLSASNTAWYLMTKDGIEVNNDITAKHQFYGNALFKQKIYANLTVYTGNNFVLTANAKYLYGSKTDLTRMKLIGINKYNNVTVSESDTTSKLYLYGSAIIANSTTIATGSDRRIKNDIASIDERYEMFFDFLKPSKYKYKDGQSGRFHLGFVAQEVLEALNNSELSSMDFAGYVKTESSTDCLKGQMLALRYEEFIALNTHMIQKCLEKITSLKAEIKVLKQKGNLYES